MCLIREQRKILQVSNVSQINVYWCCCESDLGVILNNVDSRVKQLDQHLWTTIMHFHLNTPPHTPNLLAFPPFKPAPLNSIGRLLSAWKVTSICRDRIRTGEEIFPSFSFFNHPPHTTRFARERKRERERERDATGSSTKKTTCKNFLCEVFNF